MGGCQSVNSGLAEDDSSKTDNGSDNACAEPTPTLLIGMDDDGLGSSPPGARKSTPSHSSTIPSFSHLPGGPAMRARLKSLCSSPESVNDLNALLAQMTSAGAADVETLLTHTDSSDGMSPVQRICMAGEYWSSDTPEVLRSIFNKLANPRKLVREFRTEKEQSTLLHIAARSGKSRPVGMRMLEMLLSLDADPNAVDAQNKTALHGVCWAKPAQENGSTYVVSSYVTQFRHPHSLQPENSMVAVLHRAGCDLNHLSARGDSPLTIATLGDNPLIVCQLLHFGANVHLKVAPIAGSDPSKGWRSILVQLDEQKDLSGTVNPFVPALLISEREKHEVRPDGSCARCHAAMWAYLASMMTPVPADLLEELQAVVSQALGVPIELDAEHEGEPIDQA